MAQSLKLKKVIAEIKAIIETNDLAGFVCLVEPGFSEYSHTVAKNGVSLLEISDLIDKKFGAEHTHANHTSDDETIVTRPVYLGREVTAQKVFSFVDKYVPYKSLYEAETWLRSQGYVYGLNSAAGLVAIQKGADFSYYGFPELWVDFSDEEKALVDGVMVSQDFSNAPVTVFLFGAHVQQDK